MEEKKGWKAEKLGKVKGEITQDIYFILASGVLYTVCLQDDLDMHN